MTKEYYEYIRLLRARRYYINMINYTTPIATMRITDIISELEKKIEGYEVSFRNDMHNNIKKNK